jgi:hypothetical protein
MVFKFSPDAKNRVKRDLKIDVNNKYEQSMLTDNIPRGGSPSQQ